MEGKKLLILDDDDTLRFNLQLYFEDEGFECFSFSMGEAALEYLSKNCCDAAIVDLRLPGINGEEFITEAKKLCPNLKCIIYTGSSNYSINDEIKKFSVSEEDIFYKPVEDMQTLKNRIVKKLENI